MATPQDLLRRARPPAVGGLPRGAKVSPAGGGPPQAPGMGRFSPTPVQPGDLGPGSVGPGAGRQQLGDAAPTPTLRFPPQGAGTGVPIQPPGGPAGTIGGGAGGGPIVTPVQPPGGPLPPRYAGMDPAIAAQRYALFQAHQLPGQQPSPNQMVTKPMPMAAGGPALLGFKPMTMPGGAAPSPGVQSPGVGVPMQAAGGPPGSIGGGLGAAPAPTGPLGVRPPEPPVPGPAPAPPPDVPSPGGFQSFGQIGAGMMRRPMPPIGGAPQGL